MTMKVSKGLVFPVAALPGVGHMPAMAKASRRPQGVLCGGDAGDPEVGNFGEWKLPVWAEAYVTLLTSVCCKT